MCRDVFDLMGLVKDEVVVVGKDCPVASLSHHQVGEEQVMVDDDDVAFRGSLPNLGHVAALEFGAVSTDAVLASRGNAFPKIQPVGNARDLGSITGLRNTRPALDGVEMTRLLKDAKRGLHGKLGVAREAEIVAASFHQTRGERHLHCLSQ